MSFTQLDIELANGLRQTENTQYSKELISSEWVIGEAYIHNTFQWRPVCFDDAGYGNPTGTTGDVNAMLSEGDYFEYHIKGTQTIVSPAWVGGSGLNIAMDQTADDGVEITNGITSSSRTYFDVSTENCFFEVTLLPADVSGTDDLCVGFRKAEAYQAAVDNYDEAAYFHINGTTLSIETILNNGATSTTNTWSNAAADATAITLRVEIVDRVVTFKVNGSTPWTTVEFTFDASEKVIPFLYFLHNTDLMDTLYLQKWECGKLLPATTN